MAETTEPVAEPEEKPYAPIPFKLQYKIRTVHGDYTVRRPIGAAGTKHFALVAKCAPSRFDSDGSPMYAPAQEEKLYGVFEEWVQKVLKHIIIAYPSNNGVPITFDTMPPEDQWALFIATSNLMDKGDELFRILE